LVGGFAGIGFEELEEIGACGCHGKSTFCIASIARINKSAFHEFPTVANQVSSAKMRYSVSPCQCIFFLNV
jgi:hypothetical protein